MRVAIYARVSTVEQSAENQLAELRRYVDARGWQPKEYCDTGISGAKDKRPALDVMVRDAKRRRFDVLVVWKMDRLGRSLKHLITLLEELQSLGIAFVSIGEGIDCTTPAGKLQMHILAAVAEFERGRIAERVRLGMARAKLQGRHLGRPRKPVTEDEIAAVAEMPLRRAAALLGVSKSFLHDWRLSRRVA
jgi:DNA invertase Pin-like site-specific DNA recombinase